MKPPKDDTKNQDELELAEHPEGAPVVPDSAQLKLKGVKPAAIEELSEAFDAFMEAKNKKDSATNRMNDAKEILLDKMKEHKQPMYGKRYGKHTFVASVVTEEVVNVKKQVRDRK